MTGIFLATAPDSRIVDNAAAAALPPLGAVGERAPFLAAGGEMAALVRSKDWSRTAIGPIEGWSPSLRMMVNFLLANRFPLLLWWGPDYISIYNDAYRPILGKRHPWALGMPFRDVWPEIQHVLRPLVDTPFHGGPATWMEDILLEVQRHGFLEETHFTIAYSPVPDETVPSGIGGVLATVHEITDKVVADRRVAALRDIGARSGEGKTAADACAIAAAALAAHAKDVPFALLYLLDKSGRTARLAGAAGLGEDRAIAPATVDLEACEAAPWPLVEALRGGAPVTVENLARRFASIPAGPWSDPPHTAVILPLKSTIAHEFAGFLVAGASPRLRFDHLYASFFDLVSTQIASAIATARAYEEERKRAEALAEIDRAKTRFFSNVSHEFRTPLTLMIGPIEDALNDPTGGGLDERRRGQLGVAHRNSLRLLKLVNTLLDFSRIEAGRAQFRPEPTDVGAFTAELASNFRSATEKAGLSLEIDCPSLSEPVRLDRDMWEKIVLNLLSNAFKFTFEGGIAVQVRPGEAGGVALTVADSGVGIPRAELPRVFERFHRIENQRSRTFEGSGIGLALVQELVRLHGGSIAAASELGRGTTFTVLVPPGAAEIGQENGTDRRLAATSIRADAYVEEALRWIPEPAAAPAPTLGTTVNGYVGVPLLGDIAEARILVADDNSDMRDYLKRLLGGARELVAVADGKAALDALKRQRADLVIADVMMPRLDGGSLIRAIRADPTLAETPVILLSARAGEEAKVEGLEAGADDYLTKPFSTRELLARVESHLKLARLRREATAALAESEHRFRALVEAGSDAVYRMSPDWTELRQLVGRDFIADTDNPSRSWLEKYIFAEDRPRVLAAIADAIRRKGVFELEYRVRRRDGSHGWTFSRAIPLVNAAGEITDWLGTATDVTERRRAEEGRNLLINELNHRVKNTLATVLGIAAQTLRGENVPAGLREGFEARLVALANAHDVLTQEEWHGANLWQVVGRALAPFARARFEIEGPPVRIEPKFALALSMALHELATNAVKYGALSTDRGRISLAWTLDQEDSRRLALEWRESGGPPVEPPARRGFGSRLIERGLALEVAGSVRLNYAPTGVVCRLETRLPAGPAP